jgi:hypothetical protein
VSDGTDHAEPAAQVAVPHGQGTQVGNFNTQHNSFVTYIGNQPVQVPAIPAGIHTHAEEIAGLTGLRRNLTGQFLPFVAPEQNAETHPDQLLSRLARTDEQPGVLLLGAAGTGKTRTCFEVGNRAVEQGWTVLHVTPGEPLVTTDQLAEAIARTDGQVLVIVDYLNECQGLDLVALRQRVLPDAQRAGTRVVLLASARPGWQLQTGADLAALFRLVRLEPDFAQSDRIRNQIVDSLAPTARAVLGSDRLLELCGLRPVIALLIALEAEAQARLGHLDSTLRGVRPEELIGWLHRRLREDRLFAVPSDDLFADDEPDLKLQAITAMLAAGPQVKENVLACGEALLSGNTEGAEHLLGILIAMGWVTDTPNGLAAVHDIVTDQFLERTLLRPASWTARTTVVDRLLDVCLARARTIGRYATNLGRVIRDLSLDSRDESLRDSCADWLADRAVRVGEVLAESEDEAAFALGAVVESPCWSSVAFENWASVVAPWLAHHSRSISARHLLYKGLRAVGALQAVGLTSEALQWLDVHGTRLEASFVLARLVAPGDVDNDATQRAITHAHTWLNIHPTTIEARFVLQPLLARDDLDHDTAQTAITHAHTWLNTHPTTIEARFVLQPLLARDDLDHDTAQTAITHAHTWLNTHPTTIEAGFVLQPLLARDDLDHDTAQIAITHAHSWLNIHLTAAEAQFVLHTLLARTDLNHDAAQAAITQARTWLNAYAATTEAGYVLPPLLARADLNRDAAQAAITHARTWLNIHHATTEAQFVLHPLLARDDLDHDAAQAAITHARNWLNIDNATTEAQFVLHPLLARDDLDHDAAQAAISHARAWLKIHPTTISAGFILPPLIARLTNAELDSEILQIINHWVEFNAADHGIGFIAKHLARKGAMTETVAAGVVTLAKTNPYDDEIAWHLSPIARGLDRYSSLTADVMSALEACLRSLPAQEDSAVNNDSQFDGLLEQLARRVSCCSGIAAARLDDIIDAWLDRPESLTHKCAQGTYYTALLARILSLMYSGRFSSDGQQALLKRLRSWVDHWQCSQDEERRTVATALIDQAETIRLKGSRNLR